MLNISDLEKLKLYLIDKKLIDKREITTISPLKGGISCNVVKVKSPGRTFVVKQALSKLKVKEEWFSDKSRIFIEIQSLQLFNKVASKSVPEVLFIDRDNHLFAMEAAPDDANTWKNHLISGEVSLTVGREITKLLVSIQNYSHKNRDVKTNFKNQDFFVQLRIDPYLRYVAEKHPGLRNSISNEIERLLTQKEVVAMVNVSDQDQEVVLDGVHWKEGTTVLKNLITGETFPAAGQLRLTLPAYTFMWLKGE